MMGQYSDIKMTRRKEGDWITWKVASMVVE